MTQRSDVEKQLKIWLRNEDPEGPFWAICEQLIRDAVRHHDGGVEFAMPDALVEEIATIGKDFGYSPPTLDDFKDDARALVKERHADMLRLLTGDYSVEERDTWAMQLTWAETFKASGDAKAAQFLEGMFPVALREHIASSGLVPADVMATRIIEKANLSAHLTVIANRTKNEAHAAIDAATSLVELQSILQAMSDAEGKAVAEFQQAIQA